jgi:hypothetical protein
MELAVRASRGESVLALPRNADRVRARKAGASRPARQAVRPEERVRECALLPARERRSQWEREGGQGLTGVG